MSAVFTLHHGDALDAYPHWDTPTTIVSDGAYGVRGFPGDTADAEGLAGWYRPHIAAWSEAAHPSTTLWFWGTELSWATVHPALDAAGWDYVQTITWDKGVGHAAGKVNSRTIRSFPVVTEVCSLYTRRFGRGSLTAQDWVRSEWLRSGLPMREANEACGVASAATRKYLTADHLWYFPPGDMVERMARHCAVHGAATDTPYFALGEGGNDELRPVSAAEWDAMRHRWNHAHGLTNVWSVPALRGAERHVGTGRKTAHLNQKPLELMRRCLNAVCQPGDVVWEPFGGLCSASVAALGMGLKPYAAEHNPKFAALAQERLESLNSSQTSALWNAPMPERGERSNSCCP